MSDPVRFLTSLSHALSTLGLYGEGHPATRRAADAAYRELADLQAGPARPDLHVHAGGGAVRPRPAAGARALGVERPVRAGRDRAARDQRAR